MSIFGVHRTLRLFLLACLDISGPDFCLAGNFTEGEKGGGVGGQAELTMVLVLAGGLQQSSRCEHCKAKALCGHIVAFLQDPWLP